MLDNNNKIKISKYYFKNKKEELKFYLEKLNAEYKLLIQYKKDIYINTNYFNELDNVDNKLDILEKKIKLIIEILEN